MTTISACRGQGLFGSNGAKIMATTAVKKTKQKNWEFGKHTTSRGPISWSM